MDVHLTMCIAEIHASSKPIRCRQMFEEIKYRFHYMHECFSCILREAAKKVFFVSGPVTKSMSMLPRRDRTHSPAVGGAAEF